MIPDAALEAYYCDALDLTPAEYAELDAERLAYLDAWAKGRMVAQWWRESVERQNTQQAKAAPKPERS